MPNPSNSDLVGEILERVAVAEEEGWYGYDEEARADVRELAQQLEQAEQRENALRRRVEDVRSQMHGPLREKLWAALTPDEGADHGE